VGNGNCVESIVNAAGFTILIYVGSCSTVQVRRYKSVLY
jgi:hypothetical protein